LSWISQLCSRVVRIYFLHHRELLGALSLAAYETVKELMDDSGRAGRGAGARQVKD
jgi:hypothetical protein